MRLRNIPELQICHGTVRLRPRRLAADGGCCCRESPLASWHRPPVPAPMVGHRLVAPTSTKGLGLQPESR